MAGMLFNLYPAIAFAMPIGLNAYEWTVLGLFLGICHSLIIETAIIKKLGISVLYAILLRIGTGFLAVSLLQFLPKQSFNTTSIGEKIPLPYFDNFTDMLLNSLQQALILAVEITSLVAFILFILSAIKKSAWLKKKENKLSMSFSILIGAMLGITYGAGVLINEVRSGKLSKRDILYISTFIMVFHAIIEDTLLFVLFGANMWVMIAIRIVLAFLIAGIIIKIYTHITPNNSR
jgi:cation transport ATPase